MRAYSPKNVLRYLIGLGFTVSILGSQASFGATLTICASGCSSTTISGAYGLAVAGDTLQITDSREYSEALSISKSVIIESVSGATWSGQTANATVDISGGSSVILRDLTMKSGSKRAIRVKGASNLTLDGIKMSNVSNNEDGLVVFADGGSDLMVKNSSFSNLSGRNGAAIFAKNAGSLTVLDSEFDGLSVTGTGGAIKSQGSDVLLERLTVRNVSARDGGAIHFKDGNLEVSDSSFQLGKATNFGGHLYCNSALSGSKVLISNSSFLEGTSGNAGGAIRCIDMFLDIAGTTFSKNESVRGGAISMTGTMDAEITNGQFSSNTAERGGAIWWVPNVSSASLDLDQVYFQSNAVTGEGGALYAESGNVYLNQNAWLGNSAADGGALYLMQSNRLDATANYWCQNKTSSGNGGGMVLDDIVDGVMNRNIWVDNTSVGDGGAVFADLGGIEWINNDFIANDATGSGGGLSLVDVDLNFVNNLVYDTLAGNGLVASWTTTSVFSMDYNDWYANITTDLAGDLTTSDLGSNSLFVDPLLSSFSDDGNCLNDDFEPSSTSPLIDSGDPSIKDKDGTVSDIGALGGGAVVFTDADGDGYTSLVDCNDSDATINPGVPEKCDSVDNDCDGRIDEPDAIDAIVYYEDTDGDGYGDPLATQRSCSPLIGFVVNDRDCDDSNAAVNPAAAELCDTLDNDCDGLIDESDAVDKKTWYVDDDGDGYGDSGAPRLACEAPPNTVVDSTDCDDTNAAINPGASEVCDGVDNDCDLVIDGPGSVDAKTWYRDRDLDGYGDVTTSIRECAAPPGYIADATDCDDNEVTVNPGATEICDGLDNDCDGDVDSDDADIAPSETTTWYEDSDGDGYGDSTSSVERCDALAGYVVNDGDCDDSDGAINPAASEVCDSIDNDCDGVVDEADSLDATAWFADADGDGFGDPSTATVSCSALPGTVADNSDCNDTNSAINPAAAEVCDSLDNDCDGVVDGPSAVDATVWYTDSDGDGYGDPAVTERACSAPLGAVADNTDCDDTEFASNPGATEICDGLDNDCDGDIDSDDVDIDPMETTTWYADTDGDGFGDASDSLERCDAISGYVLDDTDCDDTSATVNPAADERCDGIDNDCDGTTDEPDAIDATDWYDDLDGDGFGDPLTAQRDCSAPVATVANSEDCDDSDALIFPGAEEWCDGVDNDCDAVIDEKDAVDATDWFADEDGDGFGRDTSSVRACEQPEDYVAQRGDCDDTNRLVYPGAAELCDGIDNDCNLLVDDDVEDIPWYVDNDGDDWGVEDDSVLDCIAVPGYTDRSGDCDDADPLVNPEADEIWYDGIDQDCDGNDLDQDGDGFDSSLYGGEDCDDEDSEVRPDADEIWYDGIDQDCDGNDLDQDGDGFDSSVYGGTDCDDTDETIFPGATEIPENGIDEDCDRQDGSMEETPPPFELIKGGCSCDSANDKPLAPFTALFFGVLVLWRGRRQSPLGVP